MLEKLTDRSRKAIELAKREARKSGRKGVTASLLAVGICLEHDGVAAIALRNMGILPYGLATEIMSYLPEKEHDIEKQELLESAKQVISLANEEAEKLGHHYIGTEHLMLAAMRHATAVENIPLLKSMSCYRLDYEGFKKEVLELLGEEKATPLQPLDPPAPQRLNSQEKVSDKYEVRYKFKSGSGETGQGGFGRDSGKRSFDTLDEAEKFAKKLEGQTPEGNFWIVEMYRITTYQDILR